MSVTVIRNKMSVTVIRNKCRIFCLFLFAKLDAVLNCTIPSTMNLFLMSVCCCCQIHFEGFPQIFTAYLYRRQKRANEVLCSYEIKRSDKE
jgi:hypothetical protein